MKSTVRITFGICILLAAQSIMAATESSNTGLFRLGNTVFFDAQMSYTIGSSYNSVYMKFRAKKVFQTLATKTKTDSGLSGSVLADHAAALFCGCHAYYSIIETPSRFFDTNDPEQEAFVTMQTNQIFTLNCGDPL